MRSIPLALAMTFTLASAPLASQVAPSAPPGAALGSAPGAPVGEAIRGDLTCAAAFAIAASEQERGVRSALALPPLAARGREFFVRTGARAMDEAGLSREAVRGLMEEEVARLQRRAREGGDPDEAMAGIMPGCLQRLDAVVAPLATPDLAQCAAILQLAFEEVQAAEGLSSRARDLKILASVLDAREREALKAAGLGGDASDRAVIESRERMGREIAADGPGVERYDLRTCYDFAKPDEKKHY